jgi:hypothetical protein
MVQTDGPSGRDMYIDWVIEQWERLRIVSDQTRSAVI